MSEETIIATLLGIIVSICICIAMKIWADREPPKDSK